MFKNIRLPYPVPYYAQIASPELAEAIFVHDFDPALDPRWAESGAKTPQEYAYWVDRACGVACLKMCVEALGGPRVSLIDWARQGLECGGYLIRHSENGKPQEVGWVHSALVNLACKHGLQGKTQSASLDEIVGFLAQGKLVIASVSYEIGDDRLPITRKGGHLVVVIGADGDEHGPGVFYVNNPSGRKAELRANARIGVERFAQAYSGRVIVLNNSQNSLLR